MLANKALTDVRQRVSREEHDRRGGKLDPAWAHRRLLLRAGDTLSPKALARLRTVLATDDPSGQLSAAWAVKELLRQLLQAHGPTRYSRHETAHRLTRFMAACAVANMPETTRLAGTIEKWWPRSKGSSSSASPTPEPRVATASSSRSSASRLRLPQPGELRTTHHVAQRDPPGRMNHQRSRTPLKCEEPRWAVTPKPDHPV